MNRPSHPPSLTRSLTIVVLLISASIVAVTVFQHHRQRPADASGQPGPALPATSRNDSADPTADDHREPRPRDESLERKAERMAALDLAQRIGPEGDALVHDYFPYDDGARFPPELLAEMSRLNEEQVRIAALAVGRDESVNGIARTALVHAMTAAWLREHPDGGKKEMRILLGVMEDLLPVFARGFESLPLGATLSQGATWDPEDTTAFLVKHWDRWAGPAGDENIESIRQLLMKNITDPQLRQQLEALPKAGNN